jgi:hypothetical protein
MSFVSRLVLASLLAGSAFFALGRASSQFGHDFVAVKAAPAVAPTPTPDAGVEPVTVAQR